MKNIFTGLLFCLPLLLIGQSIEFNPTDDIYQEHPNDEFLGAAVIDIKNISGAPITLNYEVLSNTFLMDWTNTLCIGLDQCYNFIPESGTFGTLANEAESYISCSTSFWEYEGEGTVVFRVFDANDNTIADTISLTFNVLEAVTGTNNLVNDYNFKLSPNPISSDLNVVNTQLEDFEISIYNLGGQLILKESAIGKSWNGNF
jgi:hypothetical protein